MAPKSSKMAPKSAKMAPRSAKMAPKRPPNAAKMAILDRFWKLLGSIFDDLGNFGLTSFNSKNFQKPYVFSRFFEDLGPTKEPKSKKI